MYLIVGLGNPEPEYSKTRHNMGFDVINKLAEKFNIEVIRTGFDAQYGIGKIEDKKVILFKPQTYMNLSGDAISEIMNFYKINPEDIVVIYDDVDLDVGKIRIKKKGSSGGHNGIKSIIYRLNTQEFPRIRIGTGIPENKEQMIDYVISKVTDEEYDKLKEGIDKAFDAVCELMKNGIDSAMNKYN